MIPVADWRIEESQMSGWALLSFLAVVFSIAILGFRAGLKTHHDPVDFYLGGRTQSAWRSAIASFAAAESGFVFLGLVGMAYTQGFVTLWILVGVVYGYLGTWLYMAPRLRRFSEEHKALTIPQVLGAAAGKQGRAVIAYGATIVALALMLYIAVQFFAIGKTLHQLGWPVALGAIAGAVLIMSYSTMGGLRSVAYADVIQGCIMVTSLATMSIAAALKVAGGGALTAQLARASRDLVDPFGGARGWNAVAVACFWGIIGLGLTGAPHYLRKFMATRPAVSYQRAGWIAVSSVLVLFSSALFLGFSGRILLPHVDDPESLSLVLGGRMLTGVVGLLFGFFVAGVFSSIGSTADSQLLEATATLTEDGRYLGVPRYLWSSPRRTIVIIGALGIVFALVGSETVFNRTLTAWSILGSTFGPQLLLVLSGRRVSGAGILAGMITGTVTVFLWEFITPWSGVVYSLLPGFFLSGLVTILVSMFSDSSGTEDPPQQKRPGQALSGADSVPKHRMMPSPPLGS
jgi:Na+/proline symporter